MNLQSRKYIAPQLRPNKQRAAIVAKHNTRHQNAPYWTVGINLDIPQHKLDWEDGRERRRQAVIAREKQELEDHARLSALLLLPPTRPTPAAFNGKQVGHSGEHRSAVLSLPTVFCQNVEHSYDQHIKPEIANWPDATEFAYEGVERIATEWIHRRFLPLPRIPGNSTVTWQQRKELRQYDLDDHTWHQPTDEDFHFWEFEVHEETAISDEEGKALIGSELMGMLDPQDQWV